MTAKLQRYARFAEAWPALRLRLKKVMVDLDMYEFLSQPWMGERDIRTVLDVGANEGQFAAAALLAFPNAQVYSFEPIEECFSKLARQFERIPNFRAFKTAVGDLNGELEFHHNNFSPSSSFLPIAATHVRNFPYTAEAKTIRVKVARLDDLLSQIHTEGNILLKVDVQGYEDKVLAGATETLKSVNAIIVETSFTELYHGQSLFEDIYSFLTNYGFKYKGAVGQLKTARDGILQQDALFIKQT